MNMPLTAIVWFAKLFVVNADSVPLEEEEDILLNKVASTLR